MQGNKWGVLVALVVLGLLAVVGVNQLQSPDGSVRGAAVGLGDSVSTAVELAYNYDVDTMHGYEFRTSLRKVDQVREAVVLFTTSDTLGLRSEEWFEGTEGDLDYKFDKKGAVDSGDANPIPRELMLWNLLPDATVSQGDTWTIASKAAEGAQSRAAVQFVTDTEVQLLEVRRAEGDDGTGGVYAHVSFQKNTHIEENAYLLQSGWATDTENRVSASGYAWFYCPANTASGGVASQDGCVLVSAWQYAATSLLFAAEDVIDDPNSLYMEICPKLPLQTPDEACDDEMESSPGRGLAWWGGTDPGIFAAYDSLALPADAHSALLKSDCDVPSQLCEGADLCDTTSDSDLECTSCDVRCDSYYRRAEDERTEDDKSDEVCTACSGDGTRVLDVCVEHPSLGQGCIQVTRELTAWLTRHAQVIHPVAVNEKASADEVHQAEVAMRVEMAANATFNATAGFIPDKGKRFSLASTGNSSVADVALCGYRAGAACGEYSTDIAAPSDPSDLQILDAPVPVLIGRKDGGSRRAGRFLRGLDVEPTARPVGLPAGQLEDNSLQELPDDSPDLIDEEGRSSRQVPHESGSPQARPMGRMTVEDDGSNNLQGVGGVAPQLVDEERRSEDLSGSGGN